MTKMIDFTLDF